jgi:CubicO group peptidase (beta-lactamase class C family)
MRHVVVALALCASVAPRPAAADTRAADTRAADTRPADTRPADPLAGFDEFIAKTMKVHEVPGLSVAIVKDGDLVLAKGYGVRELGKPEQVDADTVFAIGSCSKAFTAAVLGLLADEGKLKWDDKVIDHLPEFRLYDPYVTRELTVRDALAHRCGLERHENVWYGSPHNRAETLKRFRLIKPDFSFRGKFSYNNVMYLVAGEVAGAAARSDWDKLVAERLLKPLEMARSTTTVRDLPTQPNVATPHDRVDEKWTPVPWRNIDNIGPAGSINSSANDMAKWVRFQLGDGSLGKTRLLSSGTLKQMHSAQTVIPLEGIWAKFNPEAHLMSYGLGWMIHDYHGKKLVEHAGAIDGMRSQVGLLPELGLGVVVLTNRDRNLLPSAVMFDVFDRYLGITGSGAKDWSAEMLKVDAFIRDIPKQQERADEEKRIKDTRPTFPAERYAGTYTDELHGPLEVAIKDGKLSAAFNGWTFDLEHWHHDTFRAADREKRVPKFLVTFTLGEDGNVAGLKSAPSDGEKVEMKRTPPKSEAAALKLTEAELKRFVGKYESTSPPLEIDVEFVAGGLKVTIGGGQPVPLEAVKPARFRIVPTDKEEFVEFELDGETITGLTVEQDRLKIKFTRKK